MSGGTVTYSTYVDVRDSPFVNKVMLIENRYSTVKTRANKLTIAWKNVTAKETFFSKT